MKFLRKHKLLSFAVISFMLLTVVDFYMMFELMRAIYYAPMGSVLFGAF